MSYEYRREGDKATFRIRTPRPVVKTRAGEPDRAGGRDARPRRSRSSRSTSARPSAAASRRRIRRPFSPSSNRRPQADRGPAAQPRGARPPGAVRSVGACNVTAEEMTACKFVLRLPGRAGIPGVLDGQSRSRSRLVGQSAVEDAAVAAGGRGRQRRRVPDGRPAAPGLGPVRRTAGAVQLAAVSAAGRSHRSQSACKCERLWLLLQSYVHPMKNYIPNGEVVLHYAGRHDRRSNRWCRRSISTATSSTSAARARRCRWGASARPGFVHRRHAVRPCRRAGDRVRPGREAGDVELRATCSEGVLGLVGMTALATEGN